LITGVLNRKKRIATWNVRSLYRAGKLHNLEAERARLNIDILGMSEERWPGNGITRLEKATMYYSGPEDKRHRNGVVFLISNDIAASAINFTPFSERCIMIRLGTNYRTMNLIQAYASTADKEDKEVENFYLSRSGAFWKPPKKVK
jgi:exonuclease III